MGAGFLVFIGSIVVFIPLFIASLLFMIKAKAKADIELNNLKLIYGTCGRVRTELFVLYTALMIGFYYEFWVKILIETLVDTPPPTLAYYIVKGLVDWDSWGYVFIYWQSLVIVYLIALIRVYFFNKSRHIKLFHNNNYVASVFNLGLYPFMVIGFIGWITKWNFYTEGMKYGY